jgi:hypothetical protein
MCRSQCSKCGVACAGMTIDSGPALRQFASQKCTTVLGDLRLELTNSLASEQDLYTAFASVEIIQGTLTISRSSDIVTLGFFKGLGVLNEINLEGNINLVDARLRVLSYVGSILLDGNPRLCSAWVPGATAGSTASDCVNVTITQHFNVTAPSVAQLVQQINSELAVSPAVHQCGQVCDVMRCDAARYDPHVHLIPCHSYQWMWYLTCPCTSSLQTCCESSVHPFLHRHSHQ